MDIFEFAKRIQVSPTTVSRAISGKGRTSANTRELVLTRMKDLGYVPNPCAQQIATGRSGLVLLYLPDQAAMSDSFALEMIRNMQRALHDRGYALALDSARESDEAISPLFQWIMSGAIDGVVLITGDDDSIAQAKERASARSPYVLYTNTDGDIKVTAASQLPHIGSVVLDTDSGARLVARMLVELGHRRIGYINTVNESESVLRGFGSELDALGVRLADELVAYGGTTFAGGATALRQLMSLPSPPTAVFGRNDEVASGALAEAKSMGIRVPDQLSIVGHNDAPFASLLDPSLTTVRVDCFEIARSIVHILLEMLDSPKVGSKARYLKPELVMRGSVAPVCR
jgi:LacI family repressor for deo operon, udp, cdd, tsx, nupC, and nupG